MKHDFGRRKGEVNEQEQTQRGADHPALKHVEACRTTERCGTGRRVSKHTIYPGSQV